jgi:hypothetical protein
MAEHDSYHGPTPWDPDPGTLWHRGCPDTPPGQILLFKEGWVCSKCPYSGDYDEPADAGD